MEPATLSIAFAVWAAVVGMIGVAIVWELSRLRAELKAMTVQLNSYIIGMERRVTHIESHMQILSDAFRPAGAQ
jgi:hypothetical protein